MFTITIAYFTSLNRHLFLILFVAFSFKLSAQDTCKTNYCTSSALDLIRSEPNSKSELSPRVIQNVELSPLYSFNLFNWSIAGNQNTPNILSELVWQNLQSYGIQMNVAFRISEKIRPSIFVNLEQNHTGTATDTDFTEDDRQGIGYLQTFDSEKGYYNKVSILHPVSKNQNLLVGLSSSSQKLNLFHEQVDKNSTYKAIWFGLEGKLSHRLVDRKRFTIQIYNDIRLSRYLASANWVLREDLKQPGSFRHYTFLGEVESSVKFLFRVHKDLLVGAGCRHILQRSSQGEDILYFSNGDISVTQLNGVNGRRLTCFFSININI